MDCLWAKLTYKNSSIVFALHTCTRIYESAVQTLSVLFSPGIVWISSSILFSFFLLTQFFRSSFSVSVFISLFFISISLYHFISLFSSLFFPPLHFFPFLSLPSSSLCKGILLLLLFSFFSKLIFFYIRSIDLIISLQVELM